MTLEAVDKLKQSKTVSVFAPSGLWADEENKEEWIDALCNFKGEVTFIFGEIPETSNKKSWARYKGRLDKLISSGIKLLKLPPQKNAISGFILFDDEAICGYKGDYVEITNDREVEFLRYGFDGLLGGKDV